MSEVPASPNPIPNPSTAESCSSDTENHAVIFFPGKGNSGDRYALEHLFLEWAWSARFHGEWNEALRVLARTLRGLEGAGLIERRTVRRTGHPTHHGFVVTDLGREAVKALSGEWIEEAQR